MKILAAIDLSTSGHEWLSQQALLFAKTHGGVVDLLFVGNDETANNKLRDLLEEGPEDTRGHTLVRTGTPVQVIIDTSADYDVLVMGGRARGALERFVLGTMAARVIRNAPCAVFVPRSNGERSTAAEPRMLVGVDLHSRNPGWCVGKAAVWAGRMNGRVDAVFADPHGLPHIPDRVIREKAEKQWRDAHAHDQQRLETLLEVAAIQSRGTAFIKKGEPESVLVAMSTDYDMVLLGTRERQGLAGLLLGSVAEHVVQNSACGVLTLPSNAMDAV